MDVTHTKQQPLAPPPAPAAPRQQPVTAFQRNIEMAPAAKRLRLDGTHSAAGASFPLPAEVLENAEPQTSTGRKHPPRLRPRGSSSSANSLSRGMGRNTMIEMAHKLPGYYPLDDNSDCTTQLLNSLIWFSAAREKRRYQEQNQPSPLLDIGTLDVSIFDHQRYCNVHRENDPMTVELVKLHGETLHGEAIHGEAIHGEAREDRELTKELFNNLLFQAIIGRTVHDMSCLKDLGDLGVNHPESAYVAMKKDAKRVWGVCGYHVNPTYGSYGADREDMLFNWIPKAIIKANLFDKIPFTIEAAIEALNNELTTSIKEWFDPELGGKAVREHWVHRQGNCRFTWQPDQQMVTCTPVQGGKTTSKSPNSYNLSFVLSRALMDLAQVSTDIVSNEGPTITGPGAKQGIQLLMQAAKTPLKRATKESVYGQQLQQWVTKLNDPQSTVHWPEALLGTMDCNTLEHVLCEWARWLNHDYLKPTCQKTVCQKQASGSQSSPQNREPVSL